MTYTSSSWGNATWGAGAYGSGSWGLHPDTISFRDRILANSGTIDTGDLSVIDTYARAQYARGLRDASGTNHTILEFGPLAGNNLAAMQVKYWYPANTPDKLTLFNIVAGDYSRTTGLTGNGTNKYASTGFIPSPTISSTNGHLAVYSRSNGQTGAEMGSAVSAQIWRLFVNFDGNIYYSAYTINSDTSTAKVAIADALGYILGNRTASNNSKVWRRGTAIATTTAAVNSSPSAQPLTLLAFNNGGTMSLYSNRSIGGYQLGHGIPEDKVPGHSEDWQALMAALGRAV